MESVLLIASHIPSLPKTSLQDTTGFGSLVAGSRIYPPPQYSWDKPTKNLHFARSAGVYLEKLSPYISSSPWIQNSTSQLFLNVADAHYRIRSGMPQNRKPLTEDIKRVSYGGDPLLELALSDWRGRVKTLLWLMESQGVNAPSGVPEHVTIAQEPQRGDNELETPSPGQATAGRKFPISLSRGGNSLPISNKPIESGADFISSGLRRCNKLMFLPLCHWYGQYNRVSHAKVIVVDQTIDDDEAIFKSIRTTYFVSRGWLRRIFSIWRLRKIERIKVCISGKFKLIHSFVYSILTLSRFLIPVSITLSVRIR